MEWDQGASAHRQQGANDARRVVYVQRKGALVSRVREALRQVRGIGEAEARSDPVNAGEEPSACVRSEGTCTTVGSAPISDFNDSLRSGARSAGGDQSCSKRKSKKYCCAKREIEERSHGDESDLDIHNLSDDKRSEADQRASSIEKLAANGILKEDVGVARIGKVDESEHDEGQ